MHMLEIIVRVMTNIWVALDSKHRDIKYSHLAFKKILNCFINEETESQ